MLIEICIFIYQADCALLPIFTLAARNHFSFQLFFRLLLKFVLGSMALALDIVPKMYTLIPEANCIFDGIEKEIINEKKNSVQGDVAEEVVNFGQGYLVEEKNRVWLADSFNKTKIYGIRWVCKWSHCVSFMLYMHSAYAYTQQFQIKPDMVIATWLLTAQCSHSYAKKAIFFNQWYRPYKLAQNAPWMRLHFKSMMEFCIYLTVYTKAYSQFIL